MFKHIKSFGVELEGLFSYDAYARRVDDTAIYTDRVRVIDFIHGDGSVSGSFYDPANLATRLSSDDDDEDYYEGPASNRVAGYAPDGYDYDNDCGCHFRSCGDCYPNGYIASNVLDRNNGYRTGEWSSPPLFFTRHHNWQALLPEWWPASVNDSCGMHVHLGLNSARDYARLLDLGHTFTQEFVGDLKRNFQTGSFSHWYERPIALRRFNYNNYCAVPDDPGFPLRQFVSGDSRYTAVNFTAYRAHGTVELRILPAIIHASRGVELIEYALAFTNDYLSTKGRLQVRVERQPIAVEVFEDVVETTVELVD